MKETNFRNRRAVSIENNALRVTVSVEGGHIAEIADKATGVNPLWTPIWPSIEPSAYNEAKHPEYGKGAEAQLLSGILGHNICLDTFGAPSAEEMAAGMGLHGEGPVIPYEVSGGPRNLTLAATLKLAQLRFERQISLSDDGHVVRIGEAVQNLTATDHPIAWTQHVTLGPPFLANGETQFRVTATRSKVGDASFNDNLGPYVPDAEFMWPMCPLKSGGVEDFSVYPKAAVSGGFSTHLMDPAREQSYFMAWSPKTKVVFGYIWRRKDFPWLARWEENHLRTTPPWNGKSTTCGMEFGVSSIVASRRQMVERGPLFGTPGYVWAPAKSTLKVEYCAFITHADSLPGDVRWDGAFGVTI